MFTPDQAKARLRAQGKTSADFARENNFPAWAVYRVLNGVDKANYGRAHEIAVKLGMKPAPDQQSAEEPL